MKKRMTALLLVLALLCLTACGAKTEQPGAQPEEKPAEQEAPAAEESGKKSLPTADTEEVTLHYRDLMVPYDQVEKAERIVVLQTALVYTGRDGLYTEAEVEPPVDITVDGAAAPAFKMANVVKFLFHEPEGAVTVYDVQGTAAELSAEEFAALYVLSGSADGYIPDFKRGTGVSLCTADGVIVCDGFAYAVTAEGEGIISVSAKQEIGTDVILAEMGWDPEKAVNIVATDLFYVPDAVLEGARGSVVAPISGTTVNAKIQDAGIAQGKINDILYLEKQVP